MRLRQIARTREQVGLRQTQLDSRHDRREHLEHRLLAQGPSRPGGGRRDFHQDRDPGLSRREANDGGSVLSDLGGPAHHEELEAVHQLGLVVEGPRHQHQRLARVDQDAAVVVDPEELGDQVGELSDLITRVTEEKFELSGQAEDLERQLAFERETVQRQLLTLASLQQDIDALRRMREQLEAQVGALAGSLQASGDYGRSLRDRSRALEARLAELEQGADRSPGARAGTQLEHLTQQDQGDDHRGGFKIDLLAGCRK